ncbi:MAG: hypothetical protein P8182_12185 [Deltaproteobacteria bacterium]
MAANDRSTPVDAKEAIACVKGPMSNEEIMARFKISPLGYMDLLTQLLKHKLISEDDLARRGIRVSYRPRKAEPEAPQMVADTSDLEDESFLDTATLTDILTFKPDTEPPPPKQPAPKPRQPVEEEPNESKKKGRFRLSGFFRKSR